MTRARALAVFGLAALLGLAPLSLMPSRAWAAITLITNQDAFATATTSTVTTLSATLPSVPLAGNVLVATISSGGGQSLTSIAGGGVSTWNLAAGPIQVNGLQKLWIYYGTSSGGSNAVTITGPADYWALEVSEWSGLMTSGTLEITSSATGNSATASSGSVTTANANDLIVALESDWSGTTADVPGNSFTALQNSGGTGTWHQVHNPAYRIVSAAGPYSTTWATGGGAQNWGGAIAAFKACTISDPSYVSVNAQNGEVNVYWSSANWVVVLEQTSPFSTEAPTNGSSYAVGNTGGSLGAAVVRYVGSGTTVQRTGLTNSTTYYYKVFTSCAGSYSAGVTINATPVTGVGAPVWSYGTTATSLAAPGLSPANRVVVPSNDNNVHLIQAANGTLASAPFDKPTQPVQARPTFVDAGWSATGLNIAYVTSQDGYVYAIDTATGAQVWKSPFLPPSAGTGKLQGGVAVWLQTVEAQAICGTTNDVVFVGTRDTSTVNGNKVYALNGGTTNVTSTGGGRCVASGTNVAPGGVLWVDTFGDIVSSTPFVDYLNNRVWVTFRSNGGTQTTVVYYPVASGGGFTGCYAGTCLDIDASPTASADGRYLYAGTTAGLLKAIRIWDLAVLSHTPSSGTGGVKGLPWPISFSTSIGQPITFVNSASTVVNTNQGSCVMTLPAVTPGNVNVVTISYPGNQPSNNITDGGSTSYTRQVTVGAASPSVEIYTNTITPTSTTTVTLSLGIQKSKMVCSVAQYAGVAGIGAKLGAVTGSTLNPSITLTRQDNNSWVVAGFAVANSTAVTCSGSPAPCSGGSTNIRRALVSTAPVASALTDSTTATNTVTHAAASWTAAAIELKTVGVSPVSDTIIFTRDNTVHSVDFNGTTFTENWAPKTLTGTPTLSAPVDDGAGNVYIGGSDGKVHQIRISDGVDLKQVTLPGATPPTVGDAAFDYALNRIYVGATDGHVYAYPTPLP